MFLASLIRRAVDRVRPCGAKRGGGAPLDSSSMRGGLARAAGRRTEVGTIIDVGASDGRWSRMASEFFPRARFLMIEAQTLHAGALRRTCAALPDAEFEPVAAGPRDGVIHFDSQDPFGGVASEAPTGAADALLPMRSIDSLVAQRSLRPPFLIKLDTHGFETPILAGAAQAMTRTQLLIVEAYNFNLNPADPGCLRFHELCAWVEQRGLRCIDICDVSRRPADRVLWQMDLFFAPASGRAFECRDYR